MLVRVCIARTHVDGIEDAVIVEVSSVSPKQHVSTALDGVFLPAEVQIIVKARRHDPSPVRIETQGSQTLVTLSAQASGPAGVLGVAQVRQPTVVRVTCISSVHVFKHGSTQGHAGAAHPRHDARAAGVDVHVDRHVCTRSTKDLDAGPISATRNVGRPYIDALR